MSKQKEGTSVETPARFQRTDQWIPVYAWLENLDQDEVVKSKDISDWLNANPQVKEQLCSRHSRYHLMHYIKKCHLKILKRREKKVWFSHHFYLEGDNYLFLICCHYNAILQPRVLFSLVFIFIF